MRGKLNLVCYHLYEYISTQKIYNLSPEGDGINWYHFCGGTLLRAGELGMDGHCSLYTLS
jgi:hypothetical protein